MNDAELLKILACPKCHGKLEMAQSGHGFLCGQCQVVYPVRDEIPIMLVDEAIALAEWKKQNPEKA